jgi:hypothetical protein
MSATASLTEPEVLAHTKRSLFPEDSRDAYVVTDTQFAKDRWVSNREIQEEVKNTLAPFNHVRVGSGYPDLVGVRGTDSLTGYILDGSGMTEAALLAVEAKGYSGGETVDVETGVMQAHDRLSGANAAYLAAPEEAVSPSVRGMARELNVGVLGVRADGELSVMEKPRPVGVQRSTSTNAIRFQATAQGVADQPFGLNHPKNYLGYVLAVYHPEPTDEVVEEYVVGAVRDARMGAEFLGLVDTTSADGRLTSLGREVVRFAVSEHGDIESALEEFDGWRRSQKRFTEVAPKWGLVARRVIFEYPATELIVEELQSLHEQGIREPTLKEFVLRLFDSHPSFAVELFVSSKDEKRERVFISEDELDPDVLENGEVYQPSTTFQLKAMMYHTGILTETGAEPSRIDPTEDVWRLLEAV